MGSWTFTEFLLEGDGRNEDTQKTRESVCKEEEEVTLVMRNVCVFIGGTRGVWIETDSPNLINGAYKGKEIDFVLII